MRQRGVRFGAFAVCVAFAGVTESASASAKPAAAQITPAERAAVRTYLTDQYEYAEAVTEAVPAVLRAYEATARGLAGECPSALAGAPAAELLEGGLFVKHRSARRRGEEQRERIQLGDLHSEIDTALNLAKRQPLLPARLALLAKLKALPAGPRALAALVKADVSNIEKEDAEQAPAACQDILAWIASGYRSLSPASRAIALGVEAEFAGGFRRALEQLVVEPLAPYEDAADRALVEKTVTTAMRVGTSTVYPLRVARRRLEAALGLKPEPVTPKQTTTTTPIGTVQTAAGPRYTVSVERTKGGSGCKYQVQIQPTKTGALGLFGQTFAGIESDSVYCLSDGASAPRAECKDGLIEIRARPLPATRRVILTLSNGRQLVSRPVLVPARLGGPAAIYFQALRGPSPIPVSLRELDARGRVLRTVAVPRVLECSTHPVKYVRGGRITLARGKTPQGTDFSIVGERYRYAGALHTALTLGMGAEAGKPEASPEASSEETFVEVSHGIARAHPFERPLELESIAGCHPHEYSIVFGLLKRPRDTALAQVAGKLVPMTRVRIPASLHMHGVLVYLASETRPERIVVRAPSGRVRMREDLRKQAVEQRETCEGESEGPGPAPGGLESLGNIASLNIPG